MRIVPEAEGMSARAPLVLLVLSLVIVGLSLVAAVAVRGLSEPAPAPGGLSLTPPAGMPVREVGTEPVQASWLFELQGAAPSTRSLPRELSTYGWVDRERGLVRIPLARAKQLYLERQRREQGSGSAPLTAPARHRGSP